MCGIVACAGRWTRLELSELMGLAAQRGPDGWGLAAAGWRHTALGRFKPVQMPAAMPTRGAILGHARLATSAHCTSLAALQPFAVDGIGVAHNGTVPDAAAWAMPWPTGNDSEVIAHWLARQGDGWPARLRRLAQRLRTPYAVAVLTPAGAVWLLRRQHPLYVGAGRACSRPFAGARLPADDSPLCLEPV
jgi:glutamine phosphoribosylpyrophosphate amidotransferase